MPLLSSRCDKLITVLACLRAVVCVFKHEIRRGEHWSPCWTGGRFGTSDKAKGRKTEKFANHSADPRGLLTLDILCDLSAGKPIESVVYCLITEFFLTSFLYVLSDGDRQSIHVTPSSWTTLMNHPHELP